jgi:hypothetical protein
MSGKRVAVMSPQTRLAHSRRRSRWRWRAPSLDPADAERAARLYRAQRRLSVAPLALLLGGIIGLPLLFAAFPGLDELRLAGVPLSWIALVVLPYPALSLLAWWQLRRAERVEDTGDER